MNTRIIETLGQYDGEQCMHIREDEYGLRYYCQWLDADVCCSTYIMVPVSNEDIARIKANVVDLRSVLDRRPALLLLWGRDEKIVPCGKVDEDSLPKRGVTLSGEGGIR